MIVHAAGILLERISPRPHPPILLTSHVAGLARCNQWRRKKTITSSLPWAQRDASEDVLDTVKRTGAHRPPLSQCPPLPPPHTFNLPVPSIFNKYTHLISKARECSNDALQVGHVGAQERSPVRDPVSLTGP